jgi:hypothetical protein
MVFPLKASIDEIFSQLSLTNSPVQSGSPRKILFWGEGIGEIASHAAGWMAGQGIDVIVLDGANRFDPYRVSSFAKKELMSPETLLKRIRIARAFTCYQMATLIEERLISLFRKGGKITRSKKTWVILLGLANTFLDEDVPEREVRPLFERSLRKVEEMAMEGIPFFLFQSPFSSDSQRAYLMKRLIQLSNWVWRVNLDGQGTKMVLEKGLVKHSGIRELDLQIVNPKFQITNPK